MGGISLTVPPVQQSVNAVTQEQIATEQVKVQEQQRVFSVIPNFYVTYEHNPAPLTSKLKFQLAMKALTDPVTITGFGLNAAIYQAVGYPSYGQGWGAYGQRLGATFAGGYTKILLGDAVYASLLHQDPRYFYQGTGTTKSRLLHALSTPFITRGDDGRREVNYSEILGDLASGAIAESYYPEPGPWRSSDSSQRIDWRRRPGGARRRAGVRIAQVDAFQSALICARANYSALPGETQGISSAVSDQRGSQDDESNPQYIGRSPPGRGQFMQCPP